MSEYIIRAADWAIDYKGESLFKGCEEIVRCRDCVFAKPDQSDHEYRGEYRCNMWVADVGADEFCSRGRRKKHGEVGKNPYGGNERKFPTADGNRGIVHCRDCRYYTHNSFPRCDLYAVSHEVEPDGFCAWAERRDA